MDVIHGPHIEPFGLVISVSPRRQEYDGNIFGVRIGLQAAAKLIAINARHFNVEKHKIQLLWTGSQRQSLFTIGGGFQSIVITQEFRNDLNVLRTIIDD